MPSSTAVLFDAAPSFPPFSAGAVGASFGTPAEPYVVEVVNHVGTVLTALPLASPGDIEEVISGSCPFDITFPKYAYTRDQVDMIGNVDTPMELRVRLGSKVLAWGPALSPQGSSTAGAVGLAAQGCEWYFGKRALDREPENILVDGNFPTIGTHWNTSGAASGGPGGGTIGSGTAAVAVADIFEVGKNAAELTGFAPATGLALTSDTMLFTANKHGNDLLLNFSLMVDTFIDPAAFNAGVAFLAAPPGHGPGIVGGINAKEVDVYEIDATTPRHTKIRGSLKVHVPRDQTWEVQVWLFVGTGINYFGEMSIEPQRSLSTADYTGSPTYPAVDLGRIVRMYADWALTANHDNGKSDLNIGVDAPSIGPRMARNVFFRDAVYFDAALAEFADRDDGLEWRIVYTSGTRVLTCYPKNTGGMGTDRSADVTFTYHGNDPTPNVNVPVASYVPSIDGGSTANQVAERGDSTGDAVEQAWFTDSADVRGVVLQATLNAPPETPRDSLLPLARQAVAQRKKPLEALEVTVTRRAGGYTPDPTVILQDFLDLGDSVTVDIQDGYFTFAGVWRIVKRVRHCRSRTMTYTLNGPYASEVFF